MKYKDKRANEVAFECTLLFTGWNENWKDLKKQIEAALFSFLLISLPTVPSSGKFSRRWKMEKMKQSSWPVKLIGNFHANMNFYTSSWWRNVLFGKKMNLCKVLSVYLKAQTFQGQFPLWFSWMYAKDHIKIAICNVLRGHSWVTTYTVHLKRK